MIRLLTVVAVVITLVPSIALGIVLSSAPLNGLGTDSCFCQVANLHDAPINVTVRFLDVHGSEIETSSGAIAPGAIGAIPQFSCGRNNPNRCEISGDFSKAKVRANYCVTTFGEAFEATRICIPVE